MLPDGEGRSVVTRPIDIAPGPIELCADVDHERLRFGYRLVGSLDWCWLEDIFDASILSDEATLAGLPNFTGGFVGMACQDMAGSGHPADFRYFRYAENPD